MFKLAIKFKQNTTIKFIKLCICSYLTGLILLALAGQVTFVQSKRLIICVTSLFVCLFVCFLFDQLPILPQVGGQSLLCRLKVDKLNVKSKYL